MWKILWLSGDGCAWWLVIQCIVFTFYVLNLKPFTHEKINFFCDGQWDIGHARD